MPFAFLKKIDSLWERALHVKALSLSLQSSEIYLPFWLQNTQNVRPQRPERLRNIILRVPVSFINPLLKGCNFSRLETLEMIIPSGMEYFDMAPITLFQSLASLRQFTLNTSYAFILRVETVHKPLSHLPWSHLTSLYIGNAGVSSSAIYFMLRGCSRLIVCDLHIDDHNDYDFPPSEMWYIELLALRRLRLTGRLHGPELPIILDLSVLEHFTWGMKRLWEGNSEDPTLGSLVRRYVESYRSHWGIHRGERGSRAYRNLAIAGQT